jgi:hypothetical protein
MAKRQPDVMYDIVLDALFVDFGNRPRRRPLEFPITTTADPNPFAYIDYVGRTGRIVGVDIIAARENLPEAFTVSNNEVAINPSFRFSTKLASMRIQELPVFSSEAEATRFLLTDTPTAQSSKSPAAAKN